MGKAMGMRLGLIGYGNVVTRSHLPAFEALDAEVVVVADKSGANIPKRHDFIYCTDHRDLFKENLDCVIVSLPIGVTFDVTMDVLKAGIPCITEKPGAKNGYEAEMLVLTAKDRHTPFSFVQNYLYGTRQMNALACLDIDHLAVGEVRFVRLESPNSGYGSKDSSFDMSWRHDRELSGDRGCLQNHGFHEIYLALHFNPSPVVKVFATFQHVCQPDMVMEDLANVTLFHYNESVSQITVGFMNGREAKVVNEVHGLSGSLSIDDPPQVLDLKMNEFSHTRYFRDRFDELKYTELFQDTLDEFLEIHKILDAAYRSVRMEEVIWL